MTPFFVNSSNRPDHLPYQRSALPWPISYQLQVRATNKGSMS
jgi:hypothetical protein